MLKQVCQIVLKDKYDIQNLVPVLITWAERVKEIDTISYYYKQIQKLFDISNKDNLLEKLALIKDDYMQLRLFLKSL